MPLRHAHNHRLFSPSLIGDSRLLGPLLPAIWLSDLALDLEVCSSAFPVLASAKAADRKDEKKAKDDYPRRDRLKEALLFLK